MIYINDAALTRIIYEVEQSPSVETGGILIGIHLQSGDTLITHAIGPGPKAIKEKNFFCKDIVYSEQVLKVLHLKYSVYYLGEWHKHVNDCVRYSHRDRLSMQNISLINSHKCCFIIVGKSLCKSNAANYMRIYGYNLKKKIVEDLL
jgi:integrative and conjugative element protein (TIGR02256 family)